LRHFSGAFILVVPTFIFKVIKGKGAKTEDPRFRGSTAGPEWLLPEECNN